MNYRRNKKYQFYLIIALIILLSFLILLYSLWTPGKDFTDGRHDLKQNGIWLQHGWLGDDHWFIRNKKTNKIKHFREPEQIKVLAALLRKHNITDVFPHLSPTSTDGKIPSVDSDQAALFLDEFSDFRVIPWVGGVVGKQAFINDMKWRNNFTDSIRKLLSTYPGLRGIHINIEPCPSGNKEFLILLDEVRSVLPEGKIISVAAFPPPTIWHPFSSVHWDGEYYKQVSKKADQLVVMMYNTALHFEKTYQNLISNWTIEILDWTNGADVLLGLPAYQDEGVGYHDPKVENLKNALLGIHAGLSEFNNLPANYQGIALYSEWEMDDGEWDLIKKQFMNKQKNSL